MVDRKVKIIICIIVLLALVFILMNIFKKDDIANLQENTISEIKYDSEKSKYYITDKNGEIIHESEDEGSLYIYTIDPEYDPKIDNDINVME